MDTMIGNLPVESYVDGNKEKVKGKKKRKARKKTMFKCDICSKHFTDKYLLASHTATHATTRAFACKECAFTCKTRKYLARHVKNRHGGPPTRECSYCGRKFNTKEKLVTHTRVHTGEKPYECARCGKCFSARYSLQTHMYIHTNEKPFKCAYCPYACRDSSTLRKHQQRHLGIKSVYQCKTCGQEYSKKYALKNHVAEMHLSLDINRHECAECGKMFRTKNTLTSHKRSVHDKVTRCKCELCGATISNKCNLKTHMRSHVDARPFKCKHEGCGKAYKDPSSLRKHAVLHTPSQYYPCEICGRAFSRYLRLVKHIDVHAPRSKVECDYCGTKFLSKNYLAKHIRQKHARKRQKFICDMCDFVTHNKPSIVMHIKYGHARGHNKECKECGKTFKQLKNLNVHYLKFHGLRYKSYALKPKVEVKIEPVDEPPFELHDIKQEIPDELTVQPEDILQDNKEIEYDEDTEPSPQENEAKDIISSNCKQLRKVPEATFDQFYIKKLEGQDVEKKNKHIPDPKVNEDAMNSLKKMVAEARQRDELQTLERTRQQYNERMRAALNSVSRKKGKVHIKHFDPNKCPTKENTNSREESVNEKSLNNNDTNTDEKCNNDRLNKKESKSDDFNEKDSDYNKRDDENEMPDDKNKSPEEINDNSAKNDDGNEIPMSVDESNDVCDKDSVRIESEKDKCKKSGKINFNTHQCYICFKLYPTKEKLLDHCKDHFDVCNNIALKKCPLCDYVTKLNIRRHLRLVHKVNIKIPYAQIKDKKDNTNGSRYYYEINNEKIKTLEVIPSVKNLNKMALINLDNKNRESKNMMIAKTKLVRKGKEWIVEHENIDISKEMKDHLLPKVNEKDIDRVRAKKLKIGDTLSDKYVDRLKRLYKIMKKKGVKMLFPCEDCDKICQTAAALKLHVRKHDSNAKPFRKKVWKHKLIQNVNNSLKNSKSCKNSTVTKKKFNEEVCPRVKPPKIPKKEDLLSHRKTKPQPIVNKHRCDPQLKEFYEKNIRGGNIEFWQFLKIFNKMDREKINDFKDLEQRSDFGIHISVDNVPDSGNEIKTVSEAVNVTRVTKKINKAKNCVNKKVISIRKAEHRRRNALKDMLREKIAKEKAIMDNQPSASSSHQAV